jgi:hypothetical protein
MAKGSDIDTIAYEARVSFFCHAADAPRTVAQIVLSRIGTGDGLIGPEDVFRFLGLHFVAVVH